MNEIIETFAEDARYRHLKTHDTQVTLKFSQTASHSTRLCPEQLSDTLQGFPHYFSLIIYLASYTLSASPSLGVPTAILSSAELWVKQKQVFLRNPEQAEPGQAVFQGATAPPAPRSP